jgi:DNA invertase Pin-like site-specific DNA recombinase
MLIGYARVSTPEQNLDLQTDALHRAGCEKLLTDKAGGASAERPGLDQALADLRTEEILVVWKLDRLGRSIRHLIETVGQSSRNEGRIPEPPGEHRHDDLGTGLASRQA